MIAPTPSLVKPPSPAASHVLYQAVPPGTIAISLRQVVSGSGPHLHLRPRTGIPENTRTSTSPEADSQWVLMMDENNRKRQKRLEQNRAAASASRNRKKLYLEQLEQLVADLKAENQTLRTQLALAESRLGESHLDPPQ